MRPAADLLRGALLLALASPAAAAPIDERYRHAMADLATLTPMWLALHDTMDPQPQEMQVDHAALARLQTATTEALARRHDPASLLTRCMAPPDLPPGLTDCRLEQAGSVAGGEPGRLLWQAQAWAAPARPIQHAAVLFERQGSTAWRLVGWATPVAGATVGAPAHAVTAQGEFLHVPIRRAGTGQDSLDVMLHRPQAAAAWREVDALIFLAELDRRLPAGVTAGGSWRITLRDMLAEGVAVRPDDAPCCPTGGAIVARLRLRGSQMVLQGVAHAPAAVRPKAEIPSR